MNGLDRRHMRMLVASILDSGESVVAELIEAEYVAFEIAGTGSGERRKEFAAALDELLHAAFPNVGTTRLRWAPGTGPTSPTVSPAARDEQRLRTAGRLLPPAVRDRQVREWFDHVEFEREAGGDPTKALRSILLRSVVPVAIGSRVRRLRRALARPR